MADFLHDLFKGNIQVSYDDMGDGTHAIRVSSKIKGVEVDTKVDALVVIPHVHHQVHEGEMFHSSFRSAGTIANGSSLDVLFVTGASGECHFVFDATNGGNMDVDFYEDTVTSDDGTSVPAHVMNRQSANTAGCTVFHTPTVTNVGTKMQEGFAPGGIGGNAPGAVSGLIRPDTEWDLDTSTKYLLRATNRAGTPSTMSIIAQWYEE